MNDGPSTPAESSERNLVEAALREAAAEMAPVAAGSNPSVRARLGGGPFVLPPAGTFPGYDLLRELHRGGQGVVYQAIQKTTRRKVAIKVMRDGPFASQREHARFEREAQILAQLNHPGIVAIHDSGVTQQGLSYFVMDYISGTPLDTYAASVKASARDAVALLVPVCEAVSAAHLKGIIHRDLKPGNIMVDGEGRPHILDFGLAKVAGGDTTGGVDDKLQLMTITGQFLGSMPWASPEQAEGRSEKIDVRTDVYALGVILYQVLTGHFPYTVVGNMREVMDTIISEPPAAPRKLRRDIPQDVEVIVLKCLAKERERRYQSAAELVRDLQHFLAGEPIEARRDSFTYVARMHLRRHKLAAAMILPFIVAAAVGGVTSAVMWRQAEAERADADALNRVLERALRGADPNLARNRDLTVREMLRDVAAELSSGPLAKELEQQPRVKAAAHAWMGTTFLNNGDAQAGESHLRQALALEEEHFGPRDLRTAQVRSWLGRALIEQGRFTEAETHLTAALEVQEKKLEASDKALAQTLNDVGILRQHVGRFEDAQALFERVIAILRGGQDQPMLASVLCNTAVLLDDQGKLREAEAYYRESRDIYAALAKGGHDPRLAFVLTSYGWNLVRQGRPCEAVTHLEQSLKIREFVLQEDDWHRGWTQSLLGESLGACSRDSDAAAESHLLASYTALKENPRTPPEPRDIAKSRVRAFYESRSSPRAAEFR
ncbi:MAG TPA: serine/threonine-protein kinase [Phycisphaerales bacterium]|nr:serine/threonine-protein kinase [Phycisphaerales bacterium]